MKILHIIDSGGFYGAERMLLDLMLAQQALGLSPVLVSIGSHGENPKTIELRAQTAGLKVCSVRMKPGLNLLGALKLFRLADQENASLIHSHGYKGNILLGLLPFNFRRYPLISTLHGWTWTGKISKMMIYEWLDSIAVRFLDKIVFVNSTMKMHPRLQKVPHQKTCHIENGIDIATVNISTQAQLDPAVQEFIEQRFTVIAVGRFSTEKNFSILFRSLARLRDQGLDIQLLLLGDGHLRSHYLEQITALGIEDRVMMPGYVDNVAAYIKSCQVLVMPSLTEGLPMTLLEAMVVKTPIIASRVGGIPVALQNGKGGVLVSAGDMDALTAATEAVYTDYTAALVRSRNAAQYLCQRYSSQRMAEDYLNVYQGVIGGGA